MDQDKTHLRLLITTILALRIEQGNPNISISIKILYMLLSIFLDKTSTDPV